MEHRCLSPWKGAIAGGLIAFAWMALPLAAPRASAAESTQDTISDPGNPLSRAKSAESMSTVMPKGPPSSSSAVVPAETRPVPAPPAPAASPAPAAPVVPSVAPVTAAPVPGTLIEAAPKSAPEQGQAAPSRRWRWGSLLGLGAAIAALVFVLLRR